MVPHQLLDPAKPRRSNIHTLKIHWYYLTFGKGNGTPLQYSCLEIPWAEEPGGLWSVGRESDTTEWLHFPFSLSCIGEGNGNPLQRSCLENPRDRGAWWAAVYGVTQSRTRLKRLNSSSRYVLTSMCASEIAANIYFEINIDSQGVAKIM